MNDATFEEKFSYTIAKNKLILWAGAGFVLLFLLFFLFISITPFKRLVPGYANIENNIYVIKMKNYVDEIHQDNYNQLLPLYSYRDVKDANAVEGDLNIAIEKVSKVINLHRVSSWTDDCYLLLGKSQYVKQDFETAEKTFEYFVDEMNPAKLAVLKPAATKENKSKRSSKKKSRKKSSRKKKSSRNDKTTPETKSLVQSDYASKGLFSKEPAYSEGLIWMAKTYIERDRYPSAAYMISKLESSQVSRILQRKFLY